VEECPQLLQTRYEAETVLMDEKEPKGCGLTCMLSLAKARNAEGYRNASHHHERCMNCAVRYYDGMHEASYCIDNCHGVHEWRVKDVHIF